MTTIDPVALRKALSAENITAIFGFYQSGELFYHFNYNNAVYEFPIATVSHKCETENHVHLAEDVGTAPFKGVMPAKELWRWIVQAFKDGRLNKIA